MQHSLIWQFEFLKETNFDILNTTIQFLQDSKRFAEPLF